MSLKAVIFDFGGVLVRTRSQHRRADWERRLGLSPGGASHVVFGSESSRAAQQGRISEAEHWQWVGETLRLDAASLARFYDDFFADDDLDTDLLAYIGRLRAAGYHAGLLSNAADNARQIFEVKYGIASSFDSITISSEEGVMKPDQRIYRIAVARACAAAQEALFIDDFLENVEGARAAGMQAVHFRDPGQALREIVALTGVA